MTDYFGYDVHFVQNVTDIDDKVRLSVLPHGLDNPHASSAQIILRARHNYLVDTFRPQHTSLSDPLVSTLLDAWTHYARIKLAEGLQAPSDSPDLHFENWAVLYARVRADPALQSDALKRDEKFNLHLDTLVRLSRAARRASTLTHLQRRAARTPRSWRHVRCCRRARRTKRPRNA